MLRLDWNALRTGDRVLVHHSDEKAVRLLAGVVASVTRTEGSHEIAVRVKTQEGTRVINPQRLSVHHDPIELDGHCWRCATIGPPPPKSKRSRT